MYFNPRTPCGVRQHRASTFIRIRGFQSTHPLRGATQTVRIIIPDEIISIHAPLAGCDINIIRIKCKNNYFNPRTPCGVRPPFRCVFTAFIPFQSTHPLRGATIAPTNSPTQVTISIHAPLAGCDAESRIADRLKFISIHAPLAGCDINRPFPFIPRQNFNPRTPCGVRPGQDTHQDWKKRFQSTHPLRGATDRSCRFSCLCTISIHAPLAGCDLSLSPVMCRSVLFQSTHPLRGATLFIFLLTPRLFISIHAPLAGCDSKIAEIFPANLRKSYKISAKPNKERRCHVLGKGKAAAISDLARCEPPGENRNTSGSHQIMSAPSGA